MKYNISSAWYLFDGRGDTGVTVSPTLGNFVPKFIRRSLFVTLPNNHQRYARQYPVISLTVILQKRKWTDGVIFLNEYSSEMEMTE